MSAQAVELEKIEYSFVKNERQWARHQQRGFLQFEFVSCRALDAGKFRLD